MGGMDKVRLVRLPQVSETCLCSQNMHETGTKPVKQK